MNNLLRIREKIKRANRLYEAQLLATKSGEVSPYRRSVFEERISKTQKAVSYTHLRAHETRHDLVCRLLLEKKRGFNPSLFDQFQIRI